MSEILHYSDFTHSDWLKNVQQPIRALKNVRIVVFAGNVFKGLVHGVVVMGGDWRSRGLEFESGHRMDYFSHLFVVKLKRPKINEKEAANCSKNN